MENSTCHDHHEPQKEARTVSIRIPKFSLPSLQSGILILLVLVGVLQTVQLYGLDQQIVKAKTSVGAAAPVSASAAPSSSSSLPNMVGGC
ncbi:hypothetical protein HZA85_03860 [Candidatus Uhrbacteria bacterium]|nr:hypothetical protein [Candidatus Uhrbacteria bacterium]